MAAAASSEHDELAAVLEHGGPAELHVHAVPGIPTAPDGLQPQPELQPAAWAAARRNEGRLQQPAALQETAARRIQPGLRQRWFLWRGVRSGLKRSIPGLLQEPGGCRCFPGWRWELRVPRRGLRRHAGHGFLQPASTAAGVWIDAGVDLGSRQLLDDRLAGHGHDGCIRQRPVHGVWRAGHQGRVGSLIMPKEFVNGDMFVDGGKKTFSAWDRGCKACGRRRRKCLWNSGLAWCWSHYMILCIDALSCLGRERRGSTTSYFTLIRVCTDAQGAAESARPGPVRVHHITFTRPESECCCCRC
mmetsp:Transcript_49491/g.101029  ORF Transcript_49491/g.101029 Transcript_49491/m.101029 type:complete len:302 (+) Transcript_49491:1671-2576(+)